ncbi:uncharacterized protein P884DRAFT_130609 [Thermothelomyces heterothallicus CBS 202.75]|uniref:uncharacterized protein n=1 Tax=Thermothelomyces heterothallicus CBS 202.75 TaxID=1149848 RepID=UPI0037420378
MSRPRLRFRPRPVGLVRPEERWDGSGCGAQTRCCSNDAGSSIVRKGGFGSPQQNRCSPRAPVSVLADCCVAARAGKLGPRVDDLSRQDRVRSRSRFPGQTTAAMNQPRDSICCPSTRSPAERFRRIMSFRSATELSWCGSASASACLSEMELGEKGCSYAFHLSQGQRSIRGIEEWTCCPALSPSAVIRGEHIGSLGPVASG